MTLHQECIPLSLPEAIYALKIAHIALGIIPEENFNNRVIVSRNNKKDIVVVDALRILVVLFPEVFNKDNTYYNHILKKLGLPISQFFWWDIKLSRLESIEILGEYIKELETKLDSETSLG